VAKEEGSSRLVVVLALAANLAVGLLKLGAGLLSGSSALLSEAAHSAGDTTTEVFLLVAQRRSTRPADAAHPFGYGKERYFWSLLAAGAIFVSGALFSFYEGVRAVTGHASEAQDLWLNYPVLGVAALMEGSSFVVAVRSVRRHIRRHRRSFSSYLRDPDDPTVNSVALEDSAALVGLAVAAAGVGLHQATGQRVWDGVASLLIGGLLLGVAFLLARACESLLIGKQADPAVLRMVEEALEANDEIVDVVDMLSMRTGTGRALLGVRADFVDALTAADLERACVRVAAELHERFPELDEVFIQPASRADAGVRERVRARYGRPLADEPVSDE
jgi:cation diffusion facilitator family transporter